MYLVTHNPEEEKQVWALDKDRMSLGRSSRADVVIDDPRMSRIHAYVVKDAEKFIFVDANSTNGSFINGVRVNRRMIHSGDIIRCGDTEFHVTEVDEDANFRWDDTSLIVKSRFPLDQMNKRLNALAQGVIEPDTKEDTRTGLEAPVPEEKTPHTVRQFVKRLKTLYQVFEDVSSVLSCRQIYTLILEGVFKLLPHAQNVCILVEDEQKREFKPVLLRNRNNKTPDSLRISKTAFQIAVSSKVALLAADVPNDPLFDKTDTVQDLHLQSILCVPLVSENRVIGVIYIDNREEKGSFDTVDAEFITSLANHAAIAIKHAHLYDALQRAYHQSILALQNVIETRDPLTMGHAYRTAQFALGIARDMELPEDRCHTLKTAAELHDIGKVAIDVDIIHKPGGLSYPEYLSVQEHVKASEQILAPIEYLHDVLPIIRQHHEHYDGSGYPEGLEGDEIMLEARILAVADSFDAIISERSYKESLGIDETMKLCREGSGKHFDPKAVEALERFVQDNPSVIKTLVANPTETV